MGRGRIKVVQATAGKAQRAKYESRVIERHLPNNLGALDSSMKRKAFNWLLGCYISIGQWREPARTSFVNRQAFISMMAIPRRMNRLNLAATRGWEPSTVKAGDIGIRSSLGRSHTI